MNLLLLPFPYINPVPLHIWHFQVHWYGIAYAVSIIWACIYLKRLLRSYPSTIEPYVVEALVIPLIIGIVVGGRLGYILFYASGYFLQHPWEVFMTWQGGMSFHGGLIGVIVAIIWYARRNHLSALALTDVIAMGTPIGLFLGRIANFINGEHYGRHTDVSWAMIFPHGGPLPRHPSQLYEAIGEGLIIWVLLYLVWRFKPQYRMRHGYIGGLFLLAYGYIRSAAELFRQPDGWVFDGTPFAMTLGQTLCIPMILAGLYLLSKKPQLVKN